MENRNLNYKHFKYRSAFDTQIQSIEKAFINQKDIHTYDYVYPIIIVVI